MGGWYNVDAYNHHTHTDRQAHTHTHKHTQTQTVTVIVWGVMSYSDVCVTFLLLQMTFYKFILNR